MFAEHRGSVLPQREARCDLPRVTHPVGRGFRETQVVMDVRPAHRDVHRDERHREHDRDRPRTRIARRAARFEPRHPETRDDHHRDLQPRPARHRQRQTGGQHDRQHEPRPYREPARLHEIQRARERERDVTGQMVRLRHVAVRTAIDRDVVYHDERRQRRLEVEQLHDLRSDREHAADEQRAGHHPRHGLGQPVARERIAGLHRDQRGGEITDRQPVHRRHLERDQRDLRDEHHGEPERRDERGRRRKRLGRAARAREQHDGHPTSRYSTSAENSE